MGASWHRLSTARLAPLLACVVSTVWCALCSALATGDLRISSLVTAVLVVLVSMLVEGRVYAAPFLSLRVWRGVNDYA